MSVKRGDIYSRFIRGGAWSAAGTVAGQGSVFATGVVIANLLGASFFGAYSLLVTTVMTLVSVGQLGSGLSAAKFVAEFRERGGEAVTAVFVICQQIAVVGGAVTAGVLAVSSIYVSASILFAPELGSSLAVVAGAVFLLAVSASHQGVLSGFEAFRDIARNSLTHGAFYLCFCVSGAYVGGIVGAAAGLSAAAFLRFYLFRRSAVTHVGGGGVPLFQSVDRRLKSRIVSFTFPAAVAGLSTMPSLWFCSVVLARTPDGLVNVAWFNAALSIRSLVVVVPSLLTSVSAVMLNDAYGRRDVDEFRRILTLNVVSMTALALVLGACVYLTRDHILDIYGPSFAGAGRVLGAAMLLACLEVVAGALYIAIVAHARMWKSLFLISLPRDVISVLLAWYWVPHLGALGAVLAIATAWVVCTAVIAVWVWKLRSTPAAYNS